ncbi:hypothetical protein [Nonomuraea cavernae]|uniref:Uncharacterized protein n=1 Tax=Nonomuraea cavernae TaxID=2045107 RepID=A0A917Z3M8_9ACTN|nr:hypothetical protein [Nonomuraea cavernae]MCA2188717.1 hypothetical protein [Nonomuraea cavernae]GGO74194.1 hypothetical protein GCM10012289_46270 [Nonomuraea cavernae]
MRRWIAGALAVSALTVGAPAYAQVKPTDPAGALSKQFVAGQGVRLTEKTRTWIGRDEYIGSVRQGVIGFGAKGVAAVENTRTPVLTAELRKELKESAAKNEDVADSLDLLTERLYLISKGERLYLNGGLLSDLLPDGKSWIGMPGHPYSAAYGDQLINVFEPATLRHLLATAGGRRGDQYRGSTTFAQLYKISPSFREQGGRAPEGAAARTVVSWRITLDARKLVKRVAVSWTMPVTKKISMRGETETRYSDWGTPVNITAPPADQVADIKEVNDRSFAPPSPIDRDYVSVPPGDDGNTE